MVLKSIIEIFPNKDERSNFIKSHKRITKEMKRELTYEEKLVAYIRFYLPFYGRNKKHKPKGCGEKSISIRTGMSVWKIRNIIWTLSEPGGIAPTAKHYNEYAVGND